MSNSSDFKYARMELNKNLKILIDADEYPYIMNYFNTEEDKRIDFENRDNVNEGTIKIVYGSIMRQEFITLDEALMEVKRAKGNSLGYINEKDSVCDINWLIDIKIFNPKNPTADTWKIPFAALIKTNLEFSEEPLKVKTLFTRYSNLSCIKNIINRPFLLACGYEKTGEDITLDNWEDHIDFSKVQKVFERIK
ncbi:hypothetical protein ACSW9V_15170 (plasmid) [Clostridium perfringens]|uniref:hypothetical protein n=1 Tax=Clostridium perfringens TaxID=1502 RepID=UPI000B36750A|nr:hypothetical protein [Clostridium perfringens]EGT0690872.1 hypothetical protein [Clostridium perfringens]EGT0693572.1 hypothetical protein [Clostridium perfringens]EGT0696529.1 hypothetical protein [Clostridium perfringens]MDU3376223.1 hypothetical protein [Clostridium perfringens]MDU3534179.1 hypothetical protein [Clostridium perfringens]